MTYTKPLPVIDDLTRPYWTHAKAHQLAVQHCRACGHVHFPPSPVCPACLSADQDWQVVSGRGTLVSWAHFHRAYWKSFAEDVPYNVCVVALEEGPRIVSNLVGPTDALRAGLAVRATFDDVTEAVSLVRFKVQSPQ